MAQKRRTMDQEYRSEMHSVWWSQRPRGLYPLQNVAQASSAAATSAGSSAPKEEQPARRERTTTEEEEQGFVDCQDDAPQAMDEQGMPREPVHP
eukprot:2259870-Amphidinium_carterae.1